MVKFLLVFNIEIFGIFLFFIVILYTDHLKSKQHKRMIRATERARFRHKLDNAMPSLLNTLDLLQTKKISEIEKDNDEFEIDETIDI